MSINIARSLHWEPWPVSERPESERLSRSGRLGGVQILDAVLKIARGKITFLQICIVTVPKKIGGNITIVFSHDKHIPLGKLGKTIVLRCLPLATFRKNARAMFDTINNSLIKSMSG